MIYEIKGEFYTKAKLSITTDDIKIAIKLLKETIASNKLINVTLWREGTCWFRKDCLSYKRSFVSSEMELMLKGYNLEEPKEQIQKA